MGSSRSCSAEEPRAHHLTAALAQWPAHPRLQGGSGHRHCSSSWCVHPSFLSSVPPDYYRPQARSQPLRPSIPSTGSYIPGQQGASPTPRTQQLPRPAAATSTAASALPRRAASWAATAPTLPPHSLLLAAPLLRGLEGPWPGTRAPSTNKTSCFFCLSPAFQIFQPRAASTWQPRLGEQQAYPVVCGHRPRQASGLHAS
jgi:hypothetical protein